MGRVKRALKRARYAAIGAAAGAALGGLFSRSAASTGGATGALVGAAIAEFRTRDNGTAVPVPGSNAAEDEAGGLRDNVSSKIPIRGD